MHKISVVIIAYNEESRIRHTLESAKWCDEIIVIDSCSTDRTVEICKEYNNCKVYIQSFLGFGPQKRFGVDKAANDWILAIDADEVVSEALKTEISNLLSSTTITKSGFYIPITMIFMNKVFNFGSENKQPHLRLFNKNNGNFNIRKLHEGVEIKGDVGKLKNEIMHCSYSNINHFFQKFNDYAEIYKIEALKNNKQVGKLKPILRFPLEFIKQYFIRLNFLNGFPGFVWSLFGAFYVFVKYSKIYEANLPPILQIPNPKPETPHYSLPLQN